MYFHPLMYSAFLKSKASTKLLKKNWRNKTNSVRRQREVRSFLVDGVNKSLEGLHKLPGCIRHPLEILASLLLNNLCALNKFLGVRIDSIAWMFARHMSAELPSVYEGLSADQANMILPIFGNQASFHCHFDIVKSLTHLKISLLNLRAQWLPITVKDPPLFHLCASPVFIALI